MLHFLQDIGRPMTFRGLKFAILAAWLLLFVGGLIGHPGSLGPYVAFTVVLTAVLISGLYRPVSYGYLFLSIFFWLGFWLKLVIHNIFQYDYVEPIGRFDGSVAAWDEALWVPTVAGLGMLAGRWVYGLWRRRDDLQFSPDSAKVPAWYPAHRGLIWIVLLGVVISLAGLNSFYGIQQSGLTPRTILIWPLNGLIYWMLSTGLSMALATILWWDICLKRDISWSIYALFAEAFFSTMSLLSRGLFVFHLVPPLLAIGLNRQKLVWKAQRKFVVAVAILGIFFVVSLAVVSTLRSYLFQSDQDFRTTTQNVITRIGMLQSVPTYEERLYIKSVERLKELEILIPMLKTLTAPMTPDAKEVEEFRKKFKQYKFFTGISLSLELERLTAYRVWLEPRIPAMGEAAVLAKQANQVDHLVAPRELWLEDHYLYLIREKAQLEETLAERVMESSTSMRSPLGKIKLLMDEFGYQLTSGLVKHSLALGVDRWIGMEGVMATVSYAEKNFDRFFQAFQEKSTGSQVSLYQTVSQSLYQQTDASKYRFASIPGATAFFYFSGSLWLVFSGIFWLVIMTLVAEYLTGRLTANKLLCALVGMNFANAVAQLGVVPRQLLIHFGMIFFMVLVVAISQSRWMKARGFHGPIADSSP